MYARARVYTHACVCMCHVDRHVSGDAGPTPLHELEPEHVKGQLAFDMLRRRGRGIGSRREELRRQVAEICVASG